MNSVKRLELRDINYCFSKKNLCKSNSEMLYSEDVNITINRGCATLLYGSSGSGKTTLLNTLIGLSKPTKGSVYWCSHKITSLKEANKLRANYMSVVFSNFSFVSELSIKENVLLPALLCKIDNTEEKLKKICDTILNFKDEDSNIDLGELINKDSVFELSNGQKEIIVIASVLLLENDFFIADEMLRSFPESTKEVILRRLIKYFKANNIAFFYVTHWLDAIKIIEEEQFSSLIYSIENKKVKKQKEFLCDI